MRLVRWFPPLYRDRREGGRRLAEAVAAETVFGLAILGRFTSDQRDLAFGVVVDSPPITLRQRRHTKVRVALAQELLAFLRPAGLRDVMEDGVHLKGNVFFGVRVRMLDEQLVLDHWLRLLATSCLRCLAFSSRTVIGDFDQCVVVVHAASRTTS